MKVSNIDKGFVEIIDFLNSHGYRPVFSCDGIEEHHEDKDCLFAYVTLLESEKVYSLMAVLLETSAFMIDISNSTYVEPYEMYGNMISGNLYSVFFNNRDGSKTKYFEDLIKKSESGEVVPDKEYLDTIKRAANVVRDSGDSNNVTHVEIGFNHELSGKFGDGIMIHFQNKEGAEAKVDFVHFAHELYGMYDFEDFEMEYYSEKNPDFNPNVERGILIWYNELLRMHFKNEDFDKVVETVDYVKELEDLYYLWEGDEEEEYDDYDYECEDIEEYDD